MKEESSKLLIGKLGIDLLTPIVSLLSNGFLIGYWIRFVGLHLENWLDLVSRRFVPHGIEIVAIIISGKVGLGGVKRLFDESFNPLREILESRSEIVVSILIVVISAVVEAYVSTSL